MVDQWEVREYSDDWFEVAVRIDGYDDDHSPSRQIVEAVLRFRGSAVSAAGAHHWVADGVLAHYQEEAD